MSSKHTVSVRLVITIVLATALLVSSAVVAGASAAASCPNRTSSGFRTYLPDCRAYELVSPPYKSGFRVELYGTSTNGDRILATSFGSFAGSKGPGAGVEGHTYVFNHTADGWEPQPVDAPFSQFTSFSLMTVSPDLRTGLWAVHTSQQPLREEFYGGPLTGPFLPVGPGEPPGPPIEALLFAGASNDLSHVVYVDVSPGSNDPVTSLWPGDTTASGRLPSLYEYVGAENVEPRLVGVSDIGEPPSIPQSHLISNCGTTLGSLPEGEADNAVSADGQTIFFTAASSSSCGSTGPPVNEVYARIGASRTVAISEPTPADCTECDLPAPAELTSPEDDALFRGSSVDGSKVFFTTGQRLFPGIVGSGPYLYEYDFNGPAGKKVTLISGDSPAGVSVLGVSRVAEDGSRVYFVAAGAITGADREGRVPSAGLPNLYVWSRACLSGGAPCVHLELVATLSSADEEDWMLEDFRPMQMTPDGRYLVFRSRADLTSDQEGRPEAGQIFRYDSREGTLIRVSRGQEGYNNDGNSSVYAAAIPRQGYIRSNPIRHTTSMAVSADGSRVVFTSQDALTRQSVEGVNNIYEYHEGQVGLISDGHDFAGVELIGTDVSGNDVFFFTADPLVPQDTDGQIDLYDARIDGGPASTAPGMTCMEDVCQNAASTLSVPTPIPSAAGEAPVSATAKTAPPHKAQKKKRKKKPKHGRKVRSGNKKEPGHVNRKTGR